MGQNKGSNSDDDEENNVPGDDEVLDDVLVDGEVPDDDRSNDCLIFSYEEYYPILMLITG